jgi:hypothetical protein
MKLGKDPMQVRIGLVVFRDKPPPYCVRLQVRSSPFQGD